MTDEFNMSEMRDFLPFYPPEKNFYFGEAYKNDFFDNHVIKISDPPDVARYAEALLKNIDAAVNQTHKLNDIDPSAMGSMDEYVANIDACYPHFSEFFALSSDPNPWVFPKDDLIEDKHKCPAAVIESAWVHSAVPEVTQYLEEDINNIVQCYDCDDAYRILKENISDTLKSRVYYEPPGPVKTKVGMLVVSYYSELAKEWVKHADAVCALTFSPEFTKNRGSGKLLNFVDEFTATSTDLRTKHQRLFRFFNFKIAKQKRFNHIEYKTWSALRDSIPDLKLTALMRDSLACFSVYILHRSHMQPFTPFVQSLFNLDVRRSPAMDRFKLGKTNERSWFGFNIHAPDDIPYGYNLTQADIIRFRIKGNSGVANFTLWSSAVKYSCVLKAHLANSYDIMGYALRHMFTPELYGEPIGRFQLLTVIYATCGALRWLPPGTHPYWVNSILRSCGVYPAKLRVSHDNTHVLYPNPDGLFIKRKDEDEGRVYEVPGVLVLDSTVAVTNGGDAFIMIGDYSNKSLLKIRKLVGSYDLFA